MVVRSWFFHVQGFKKINLVDVFNCSPAKWNCSDLDDLHNLLMTEIKLLAFRAKFSLVLQNKSLTIIFQLLYLILEYH